VENNENSKVESDPADNKSQVDEAIKGFARQATQTREPADNDADTSDHYAKCYPSNKGLIARQGDLVNRFSVKLPMVALEKT
jgi:hypothetical protein